jgi:hypothetical protein
MMRLTIPHKIKKFRNVFFVVILIIIAVIPSLYFYLEYQKSQQLLKNPSGAADAQVQLILSSLGRLMDLPTGETPTVATITDKEKLASQPFFQKAKNGDKLVIYTLAKKAILYDPNRNMIIDVSTINIPSPTQAATASESGTLSPGAPSPLPEKLKVVLLNGTMINGLTRKYETELKTKAGNQTVVVDRDNAKNQDYEKTLMVDLKGKNSITQRLAATLGMSLVDLPTGESSTSSADILIIVGKDKQ